MSQNRHYVLFSVVAVLLIYALFAVDANFARFSSTPIKSAVDDRTYFVVERFNDKQRAADFIANINKFAAEFVGALGKEYGPHGRKHDTHDANSAKGRYFYRILAQRYDPRYTTENDPPGPDSTSFNKNKGEEISLCLREKKSGNDHLHDEDLLKFVMLHELVHTVTPGSEHPAIFWENFKFVLEFCEHVGLYTSKDYYLDHTTYCGMTIRYNPRYDPKIKSYWG